MVIIVLCYPHAFASAPENTVFLRPDSLAAGGSASGEESGDQGADGEDNIGA